MATPSDAERAIEVTFSDLFCGAGGLSLGFAQAGFRCVQAIDSNPVAVKTYRLNFRDSVICDEVAEETALDPVDVLVGGPPCQGFSSAGARRSDDARNSLVRVYAEIIARHRPRAFVFENVEGFLTADGGLRVLDLLEPVVAVGYQVHLRKVNAANYGVAQHRKRVIAIGGFGWSPDFPLPTHMTFGAPGAWRAYRYLPRGRTVEDALAGLGPPAAQPPGTPQGHWARDVSDIELRRIQALRPGQSMKDLPQELWHNSYRRRAYRRVRDGTPSERRGGAPFGLRRLRSDQPSKAITSGATTEFVHPTEDRYLTIRECARLQGFPDDFIFAGTHSQMMAQIGNAVPPVLGRAIADALLLGLQEGRGGQPPPERGRLLSFEVTTSTGMSPALARVCALVRERFAPVSLGEMKTGKLWP